MMGDVSSTSKDAGLTYALLKSNMISNLTQLRQECALMWQIKPSVTVEDMHYFIENMRARREYLLEISSNTLKKEDHDELKNLFEDSLNNYFKQFDLQKRQWVKQEI